MHALFDRVCPIASKQSSMMATHRISVRTMNSSYFKFLVAVVIALCTFLVIKDTFLGEPHAPTLFSTFPMTWSLQQDRSSKQHNDCRKLPGADRVLVILKTGATAAYERLPIHFETTLKCMPKYVLISDLEDTMGDVKLIDVLKLATNDTREKNDDFKIYHQIQGFHESGQDMSALSSDSAWTLDKYKFLPMMHVVAERLDNEIDWVVMMEADTSISWLNLLLWLKTMDAKKAIYTGSPALLGQTVFAHGGSGIVMSRAAVNQLEATRLVNGTKGVKAYDQKWEDKNKHACCGDGVLAMALLEAGVNMTSSWPLIQGESILTLDWQEQKWCAPAITWHHIRAADVNSLWHFEQEWMRIHGTKQPYLYRDVFKKYVQPHLLPNRPEWDNAAAGLKLSRESEEFPIYDEPDRAATELEGACAMACKRRKSDCIQWKWKPGHCVLDKYVRLGQADLPEVVKEDSEQENVGDGTVKKTVRRTVPWRSGWMLDRVDEFIASQAECKIRWSGRT